MPLLPLYLLLTVLDLLAIALDWPAEVRWLTKPSLMLVLAAYVWREGVRAGAGHRMPIRLLLVALAFAWVGDVALLGQGQVAFLVGLGAFLLGHLVYLALFGWLGRAKPITGPTLWGSVAYAGFVAAVILRYLPLLWPALGPLASAVQIYMAVIAAMTVAAAMLWRRIPSRAWAPIFGGTVLFVVSDAVLAWQLFRQGLPGGDVLVMLTYAAAQGLIAWGVSRTWQPVVLQAA